MNEDLAHIQELEARLKLLEAERAEVLRALSEARARMAKAAPTPPVQILGRAAADRVPSSPAEKIELFLSLFRCREDVFPKHWENKKTGNTGYAPACKNDWVKPICHPIKNKKAKTKNAKTKSKVQTFNFTFAICFFSFLF